MITIKHTILTLALTFCALLISVQAQTPRMNSINVTPEAERVRVSAIGDVSEMRIEVVSEAGDIVFESGAITGTTLDWNMRDAAGERVQPGTYNVTVTFRNAAGKLRKRVEQVTVTEEEKADTQATQASAPQAVQATVTTSGTTTTGRIPKFSSASTITNSVITESASNIGIGTVSPASKLHVVGEMVLDASAPTLHTGAGSGEFNRYLHLINSPSFRSASGLKAGGVLVSDTYSYANPGKNDLIVKGNVGIGTANPAFARLYVLNNGTGPYAVYATGNGGVGVWGKIASGTGVRGTSSTSIGVKGESSSNVGVVGVSNTKSNSGAGVGGYNNAGGWAMYAGGNAGQALNAGGWVKFMARIDPSKPAGSQITHCYNSQEPDGGASKPQCGFTAQGFDIGAWRVNFGYNISGRFAVISIDTYSFGGAPIVPAMVNRGTYYEVVLRYSDSGGSTNADFTIIVY